MIRFCVRDQKTGAPGAIPTRDLPLRRRTLYAAELREPKVLLRKKRRFKEATKLYPLIHPPSKPKSTHIISHHTRSVSTSLWCAVLSVGFSVAFCHWRCCELDHLHRNEEAHSPANTRFSLHSEGLLTTRDLLVLRVLSNKSARFEI